MAKKSMIAREKKRAQTVVKYAAKRAALKAVLSDQGATEDAKWEAQIALQKLPRDASPVRPAVLTVCIVNLACAVTSCVKRRCAVMYLVWLKPAGNGEIRS